MNASKRITSVLLVLSLLASGLTLAQDALEQEARDALLKKSEKESEKQAKADHNHKGANARTTEPKVSTPILPRLEPVRRLSGTASSISRNRWSIQSSGAASVLVIPSAEIETKDLLTINEDLNIMLRIFETNLQKARIITTRVRILGDVPIYGRLFSGRGNSSIQSLYLQGYGVLFMMKVDFPLSPGPQAQQQDEAEKKQEGSDEVWEDMRDQLYEPEKLATSKTGDSAEKYDAEKVENLKTALIKALKHAANIRNLKPDEWAILTITGSGESDDVQTVVLKGGAKSDSTRQILVLDKNTGITKVVEGNSLRDIGLSSPTVLAIRAKKSDIDSFAKGDIDLDQFRRRVQMLSYPYLGGISQHSAFYHYYYSNP